MSSLKTEVRSISSIQIIVDGIKIDTTNCYVSIDQNTLNPKLAIVGISTDPAQAGELADRLRIISNNSSAAA